MIEDLIQQIHLCRNSGQLDSFYTTVKNGFCSGYYSMNPAIRAINEINHRLYSDFAVTTPKSILFSCAISEDNLLIENGNILSTESGVDFIL